MGKLEIFVFLVTAGYCCTAYSINGNPYHQRVFLNRQQTFQLEWRVDWDTKRITFNVTAQTTGWVGFGLSRKGKMLGSDMIMGGVRKDGTTYFSDRHALGNALPVEDDSQDWTLHSAWERNHQTFLSFSRALDTCDEDHDLPIDNNLKLLIWAYSETDDLNQYHYQTKGSYHAYLLDPNFVPRGVEDETRGQFRQEGVKLWNMTRQIVLKPQDTQYFCSFHKIPTNRKHHIIGFNTGFPTDRDFSHVHHIILHRCRAPPTADPVKFFEAASRSVGTECYILDEDLPLPVNYCRETIHVWGAGGRAIFLPEHAGIPMSYRDEEQYFMFQVHYDNPQSIPTPVTVSLEVYYTDRLREHDVGVLQLGDMQPGATTILVPPSDPGHVQLGQCAPGCTERILGPNGGGNIIAVFLHTHLSGRGVRAMHLRDGKDLPWIQHDDNYYFNFQQFRVLREERHVEPGDTLVSRCNYDNTDRNGSVITGGFSTREEMCTNFMYYYNRNPGFALCRSDIRTQRYMDFLGIHNVTWDITRRQMFVTGPPEFEGLSMAEYANNHMNWNLETRRRLQEFHLYETQTSQCARYFYDDPQVQIETQIREMLPVVGRMPGSDGRQYTSVDNDVDHESTYPRNGQRWAPPPQCSRRSGPEEKNEVPTWGTPQPRKVEAPQKVRGGRARGGKSRVW